MSKRAPAERQLTNHPEGWGKSSKPVVDYRKPRGGKPIRPEPEVRRGPIVPPSGYARARTVDARRHLTAKSIKPGVHRLIGAKGNAYDVLTSTAEDGWIVFTVKSLATGNDRTWKRRPTFPCEYINV